MYDTILLTRYWINDDCGVCIYIYIVELNTSMTRSLPPVPRKLLYVSVRLWPIQLPMPWGSS